MNSIKGSSCGLFNLKPLNAYGDVTYIWNSKGINGQSFIERNVVRHLK